MQCFAQQNSVLSSLLQECQCRRLRAQEVLFILSLPQEFFCAQSQWMPLFVEQLPFQPGHGQVFLIHDTPTINKNWKKDQHVYARRRKPIQQAKCIVCLYSQVEDSSETVLNRRIYRLAQRPPFSLYLVHYLTGDKQRVSQVSSQVQSFLSDPPLYIDDRKNSIDLQFDFSNLDDMQLETQALQLVELCPEQGRQGDKLLIIYPPESMLDHNVVVQFGQEQVQGEVVQPGVIKCRVPAHPGGQVQVRVVVQQVVSTGLSFEYKHDSSYMDLLDQLEEDSIASGTPTLPRVPEVLLPMADQQQDQVRLIQKNVRGWLLRRQYTDIKCAVRVLQKHLRQKISQRHEESAIEDKIKDWLKQGPI